MTDLAIRPSVHALMPAPIDQMVEAVQAVDAFYHRVLREGVDYGKVPGSDKPTLLQPGAQMFCRLFSLRARFTLLPGTIERWDDPLLFHYNVQCDLLRSDEDHVVGGGIGSCNSREDRYAWRQGQRSCPRCGAAALRKSKPRPGRSLEWYCWSKIGGCGETFPISDPEISAQEIGRVPNPDLPTQINTILKMAQKRALVAAVLNVTGAGRIFTQDLEDHQRVDPAPVDVEPPPARPAAARQAPQEQRRAAPHPADPNLVAPRASVKLLEARDRLLEDAFEWLPGEQWTIPPDTMPAAELRDWGIELRARITHAQEAAAGGGDLS